MRNIKFTSVMIAALLLPLGTCVAQAANSAPNAPALAASQVPRAATPVPKSENTNWMPQHEANVALVRKGGVEVLFVGDSLTKCWSRQGRDVWAARFAPLHATNIGISGDCTQHVLWRLQNGELENTHPKAVVLLIGTNNISAGDSPADIAQAVSAIIGEIRQRSPEARILLLGILPRSERANHAVRETVRSVNGLLSKLEDADHVTFLDFGDKLLEPDGSLTKDVTTDFTHLTANGYTIFADAIQPIIERLLGKR
jgi:lysophospholipase L1-like esterase